jgi:hypothetical protein
MPHVRDVLADAISEGRYLPVVLSSKLATCTDISPEKRTFLACYTEALLATHSESIPEDTGETSEPVTIMHCYPTLYRLPDGTLTTSDERNNVIDWKTKHYIETGIKYGDQYGYSRNIFNSNYQNRASKPEPKSKEQVLDELGPKIRAMYEAAPATYVPVGTLLRDILNGTVKHGDVPIAQPESGMNTVFHPPPRTTDLFTEKRTIELKQLCRDLCLPAEVFDTSSWVHATNMVSAILRALNLNVAEGDVRTDRVRKAKAAEDQTQQSLYKHWYVKNPVQKHTMKVVWPNRTAADRAFLPEGIRSARKYQTAVTLMGKICGRMLNMSVPALSAEAALLDKTGVFTNLIKNIPEDKLDIDTAIFCCIVSAKLSVRKAFALTPQIQGSIDKFMLIWYRDVLCTSSTTQWNLVASLLPIKDVLGNCSHADLQSILGQWIQVVSALRGPLQYMWENGVKSAASRNMLVPRGVNTTAWNTMTGAWNNARRFISSLCMTLDISMPWAITKCMKVTAGDQMKWGNITGQDVDPDCMVFAKLAEMGRAPWSAIDDPTLTIEKRMNEIAEVCSLQTIADAYTARGIKNPIAKWRIDGVAKMRKNDVQADTDMVCGCAVAAPGIAADPSTWDICRIAGFFGATPWTGS